MFYPLLPREMCRLFQAVVVTVVTAIVLIVIQSSPTSLFVYAVCMILVKIPVQKTGLQRHSVRRMLCVFDGRRTPSVATVRRPQAEAAVKVPIYGGAVCKRTGPGSLDDRSMQRGRG